MQLPHIFRPRSFRIVCKVLVLSSCDGWRGIRVTLLPRLAFVHDLLFANPGKLDKGSLVERARSLKLDENQFKACLSSGKHKPEVERDAQEGNAAGGPGGRFHPPHPGPRRHLRAHLRRGVAAGSAVPIASR